MTKALPYKQATAQLSLAEKVGQLFMPAAFINDTEDEIRQLEDLIETKLLAAFVFSTLGLPPRPILRAKRRLFVMKIVFKPSKT